MQLTTPAVVTQSAARLLAISASLEDCSFGSSGCSSGCGGSSGASSASKLAAAAFSGVVGRSPPEIDPEGTEGRMPGPHAPSCASPGVSAASDAATTLLFFAGTTCGGGGGACAGGKCGSGVGPPRAFLGLWWSDVIVFGLGVVATAFRPISKCCGGGRDGCDGAHGGAHGPDVDVVAGIFFTHG